MAFGFPAHASLTQQYNLSPHLLTLAAKEALESLDWPYTAISSTLLEAEVSATLYSWGEKLKVEVSSDGTVTAKSRCVLATQCFDWGKNRGNVKAFFNQLSRTMAAHELARSNLIFSEEHSKEGRNSQIAPPDDKDGTPLQRLFVED